MIYSGKWVIAEMGKERLKFNVYMETSGKKNTGKKKINWAIPGQTVTQEEFVQAIREAEKGPFYTIQESMNHFEQWLNSRENR